MNNETPSPVETAISEFTRYNHDVEMEKELQELFAKHEITPYEAVLRFPIFARRVHMRRYLAHYELFRRTIDLPGDIVELGVFRGLGLMTWANLLEIFQCSDRRKKVWGFDNFVGFRGVSEADGPSFPRANKEEGFLDPSSYQAALMDAIKIFDKDRYIPWMPRIEFVAGDIQQTVPDFVKKYPGMRLSILHLDVDIYEPSKIALEYLFPKVVKGGVVIFDEYALKEWAGESSAVDEYFKDTPYVVKRFPWSPTPGGYLIKE